MKLLSTLFARFLYSRCIISILSLTVLQFLNAAAATGSERHNTEAHNYELSPGDNFNHLFTLNSPYFCALLPTTVRTSNSVRQMVPVVASKVNEVSKEILMKGQCADITPSECALTAGTLCAALIHCGESGWPVRRSNRILGESRFALMQRIAEKGSEKTQHGGNPGYFRCCTYAAYGSSTLKTTVVFRTNSDSRGAMLNPLTRGCPSHTLFCITSPHEHC